jgi:hypothetical protein
MQQLQPAVAAGNGIYLVVWSEFLSSSQQDVYGARINATTGALLDSQPIRIAQGPSTQSFPAAAFDGTNFLVVWSQSDSISSIYATRVSAASGAVLDAPRLISRSSTGAAEFASVPDIAFDGTNYLAVWQYPGGGVRGTRVRASDGQPLEASSFIIDANHFGLNPRVAYGGGRFLVVWYVHRRVGNDVEAARIDAASGALLDTVPRTLSPSGQNDTDPDVASRGDQFLVAWEGDGKLRATRVRGLDGASLDGTGFIVGDATSFPPAVTFDGASYRVSSQGMRAGARKLLSTRISATGVLEPGAEEIVSPAAFSWEETRADTAAVSPGRFLVAYTHFDSTPRVRFRLVEDSPETPCDPTQLSLVLNGASEMTLECGSGTYSDPGAHAFNGCGDPVEVHSYNSGNDPSGPGPNLSVEGGYTVSYAAWDAAGQTVNASRIVHVDDRTAPTLRLRGAANMTHTCGSQWVDPGVDAMDACYGNLEHTVWRTGEVNGWAQGTYTVTYTLTDSGGNTAAPVTRTVQVVNCPW